MSNETVERERRIVQLMAENAHKSALEASRGYCAAYVDGMIAIDRAVKRREMHEH